MNAKPRQPIPVEKELWSEESRNSLDYVFASDFYEDQPFSCRACGLESIFTAEQQKYTYEVKKTFTWERHVLCQSCFQRRNELSAEAAVFQAAWTQDKAALKRDYSSLQRWMEVLEQLPSFGIRKDAARIRMLKKLLNNAASA